MWGLIKVIDIPEEYRPEISELPGDLEFIARGLEEHMPGMGVWITLVMAQIFPGQPLYIRSIKDLLITIRDDAMRKEYDEGAKVKELAFKFHLSTRWVEDILSRTGKKNNDRQMRLF
jgi:Mor family transcriptional regulator